MLFLRDACVAEGLAVPHVFAWETLLTNRRVIHSWADTCDVVRIESPGENPVVHQLLLRLGGFSGEVDFGELVGLKANFEGFSCIMNWLGQQGWEFQNHPVEMLAMFDKWTSHRRFLTADLPRPKTILAPNTPAELRQRVARNFAHGRVFLKPRYSSSAAGVCAFHCSSHRELLIAPIGIEETPSGIKLFNSLKIRSYTRPDEIDLILGRLLPEGYICEAWIPKARTSTGRFDLRVLVIEGAARHWVVRTSESPMTNLHLGNQRGDRDVFKRDFGKLLPSVYRLSEQAAACFPRSHYAGVDIIIDRHRRLYVCEINGCGDLLPGVIDKGESTFLASVRSLVNLQSDVRCSNRDSSTNRDSPTNKISK